MEKRASTRIVVAIILAVTLILASLPSLGFSKPELAYASQTDQSSLTPSETIYFSFFLTYPGSLGWVENLWFDFNNTVGIPLNMSSSAFDQHFQSADYSIVQGTKWDEFLMVLTVSYDAINVDLAENRTDEICGEFQDAFNLNLTVIDKWHEINNETGYVTVYRSLGYIHLEHTVQDLETIEELVKYKPSNGFGQLLNTGFLNNLLSYSSTGGLMNLEYTLKRVDQNTFSWRFVVAFEPAWGDILADETQVSLNLSEILNYPGAINASAEGLSRIQVDIDKGRTVPAGTYNVILESISPPYSSREEDGDILITYNLNGSMNNVVASIRIAKVNNPIWTNLAILGVVLLGLAASCLAYTRRRRRLRKHVGPEKTADQGVK
jgi:hypothetical protein